VQLLSEIDRRTVAKQTSLSAIAVSQALAPAPSAPGPEEIRAQLEKVLASRVFARSTRLCRFLRFSVEESLAGNGGRLKEQIIGMEVFDRKSDYDPRIDPIVRVEARRLRAKLKAYYTSPGRADSIMIGLPKGAYLPFFKTRAAAQGSRASLTASAGSALAPRKSIAILPFANMMLGADDDYFSDGLTEELIHLLTRIPSLRVVAWNSASKLRGREADLAGIRRQLRVGTVLRGSVRRTLERVRVTVQLIDSASGDYLWSETYDRGLENVFEIQGEMARAIVQALRLKLTGLPQTETSRRAPNVACYNLCLQGRFHANKRTTEGLRKTVERFEEAILADDSCAEAYAGLADAYSLLANYGLLSPADAAPKARAAAERALELDPQSAEANVSLAFVRSAFEWRWEEGEVLYRAAIAANPGYSRAHHWYSVDYLGLLGRCQEALSEIRAAYDLDPLSMIIREGLGYMHMICRDYPRAVAVYREITDMDPDFYKGYSSLGRVLSLMGKHDLAVAALERARELGGEVASILGALGEVLARAGRVEEARTVLHKLTDLSQTRWVPASSFAILHLGLGDYPTALTFLETATDRREFSVTGLKVHPLYDPLRSEPRFQRLLERIGLLPENGVLLP
jgi:TolB-like protein/tetratricopeptide (TPR) repeat protein